MKKKMMFFILAAIVVSTFTSCSRYIVDNSMGGACGVWYPKVFNPNKKGMWENPRGAAGW